MIYFLILLVPIIVALFSGFSNCVGWRFLIGTNNFSTPYFTFGITNELFITDEEQIVQIVSISFLIVFLNIEFYKE